MDATICLLLINAGIGAIVNSYVPWSHMPGLYEGTVNKASYIFVVLLGVLGIWLFYKLCLIYREDLRAWSGLAGYDMLDAMEA